MTSHDVLLFGMYWAFSFEPSIYSRYLKLALTEEGVYICRYFDIY